MVQNDIRKFLVRNAFITYTALVIAVVCVIANFFTSSKAVDESRKYLYMVNTEGEIIPLAWANRRDNLAVEMKHHIQIFVENFYSLNQNNWESRVEKALWLGDFEQQHIRRSNDGFYNRFIQFGIAQEGYAEPENIELVSAADNSVVFRIIINLTEYVDKKNVNRYSIFGTGRIKMTDRNFPKNPHGMYIENFVEEKIIKEG